MAEKLITKSFERLFEKGKHRGFITYEELGKSLGKRNSTNDNIERAFIILVDEKITLVEKKSQYQSNKKKESATQTEEQSSDKSDDPIRMYLREMGGVELLSREGEMAIAKRIEAGKDVMINALTQSPIVGKKIFEWREQIENQQMLVRDIIDIDSTYEDFEALDDDDELKNLIERVLVLEVKNDNGLWKSYTGLVDPSKNTVTVNFNSPISFNSVTASQAGSTLTIENVNSVGDILIYPNPTADKIYIQYNSEILAQLYDVAGRRVISTNEKSINMNSFKSGTYILKLTNEQNESHSFKIIKN